MKIAFLNFFQQINNRGAETFVDNLSKQLSSNHQVKVYSYSEKGVPSTNHQLNLLRRLYLDPLSLMIASWTFKTIKDLNSFQPDVVFVLNGGWQAFIIRLWTLLKGKKLIITGQSGPGWDDRFNLLIHPDIFVCLTRSQLNWAKQVFHYPAQQFTVIGNGVDLDKFSPQGKKAEIKLQKPIIITIAALEPAKRVLETIKAVSCLKKGSLLVLGQGSLKQKTDSLAQKLLGSNRYLNLSVKHSDVPKYLRSSNLFTLCSASSEAFGIVYLEAMACGLPVVATRDATRREIIGTAGIFVKDPANSAAYSRALESALSKKYGKRPIKQAQNYSWEIASSKYEKILNTL